MDFSICSFNTRKENNWNSILDEPPVFPTEVTGSQ